MSTSPILDEIKPELDQASKSMLAHGTPGVIPFYWLALAAIKLMARLVDAYIATH